MQLKDKGGGSWANKKYSCTAFTGKIKIVHSGTKQRNILQASDLKLRQSVLSRKKFLQNKLPTPHLKNVTVHP